VKATIKAPRGKCLTDGGISRMTIYAENPADEVRMKELERWFMDWRLTVGPAALAPAGEPEWQPTHRHMDGGLYRFEREVMIRSDDDEAWREGVEYTCDRPQARPYVTSKTRWQKRFIPLK
jgi:hypothetical protein